MLEVLFPLPGASYCIVYLFIILIYSIANLNILMLLCISIASIACAAFVKLDIRA